MTATSDAANVPWLEARRLAINEARPFRARTTSVTTTSLKQSRACCCADQGDLATARMLFERALAGCRKDHGGTSIRQTAASLSKSRASCLKDEGGPESGHGPCSNAPLAVDEEGARRRNIPILPRPRKPRTVVQNRPATLAKRGPALRAARLAITEKRRLDPNHPRVAAEPLPALRSLHSEQGDLALARPLL